VRHSSRRVCRIFGDSWVLENLEALVYYINTEAGLASADVTPVRHMITMLCDRLKFVDYLKRTPAVHDEVIEPVGVILGPGTGWEHAHAAVDRSVPQLRDDVFLGNIRTHSSVR